jgi:hypothetical protein
MKYCKMCGCHMDDKHEADICECCLDDLLESDPGEEVEYGV